ncbi:MAG TPA: OmpA family protein [Pseudoxanthomonas sp.]
MNRFSVAALRVLIGVFPLALAACAHTPADIPSIPALPALDEPAQPINQHGGTEEYYDHEISFDFNQVTLKPQAVSKLDEGAEILKKYPDLIIEVSGHADSRENQYRQLSLRRARAAYDYLLSKGADACQMLGPVGYGASRPIYVGDDNPEHPLNRSNRRVDVNVQNCDLDPSLCNLDKCESNSKN